MGRHPPPWPVPAGGFHPERSATRRDRDSRPPAASRFMPLFAFEWAGVTSPNPLLRAISRVKQWKFIRKNCEEKSFNRYGINLRGMPKGGGPASGDMTGEFPVPRWIDREGDLMRIRIDLEGVAPDEQLDFWQSVTPSAYRVGRTAAGKGRDLQISIWTMQDMMANRFSAGAHMTSRELPGVRRSHSRFVKVRLYRDGGSEIHHDGGVSRLRPGDVHVIDHARPWSAYYHSTHDQNSIFIPHDLIGYDSQAHPVVRTFPKETPRRRSASSRHPFLLRRPRTGREPEGSHLRGGRRRAAERAARFARS